MNEKLVAIEDINRFWSKVKLSDDINECWEWQAGLHRQGYGKFSWKDKTTGSHIMSWIIHHNNIPEFDVIHLCKNHKCVNPHHLVLRNDINLYIHRFWTKVDKSPGFGPDYDCWKWTGGIFGGDYGQFNWLGKPQGAHRASWIIHYGDIPPKMEVCHKCDNPICVNPEHLFLGTHKENMADRERKGRRTPPRGSRNGKAKLTEKQVIEIKKELKEGKISGSELARQYGVTKTQISLIKLGKSWNHISI